jgi:cytochrome c
MNWTERLIGSLSVIVSLLLAGEGWTQDVSRSEAGFALARRICSECHALESKSVPSPNSAAPRFETIANVPGMTAIVLSVALQRSHKTMPNIILNSDELRDIVSYILSLQRAN